MYNHPCFNDKAKEHDILWRYLSLERFLDLLITQELHFGRIDQFGDHFEGMWATKDYESVKNQLGDDAANRWKEVLNMTRKHIAVSCWHESETESAAMWQIFNTSRDGVAILTTFGKLQTELSSNTKQEDHIVFFDMARVKYLNHLNESFVDVGAKGDNLFYPPMCKNSSYTHEKEVRALIANTFMKDEFPKTGYKLKVDVNNLIDKVIINPNAPKRINNTLASILDKYNYKAKLYKSALSKAVFEEHYQPV